MNKNGKIYINNKNGEIISCDIIATYEDEKTLKKYIIYTDNTFDIENKLKIYSSLYEEINNNINLIDISTNEERAIILEMLKSLIGDIKK